MACASSDESLFNSGALRSRGFHYHQSSHFDYGTVSPPQSFPQGRLFHKWEQPSTPVMHPNLVNTLKSIISDQSGLSGEEWRRTRYKRNIYALASFPPYITPPHHTRDLEEDKIAVVPMSLIEDRRPFKCLNTACTKTFKNPQTMKMHSKSHPSNDSCYSRGVVTSAHVCSPFKAGHNKKIPSRCPRCFRTFVGLYELRRHFGRKHSEGEKKLGCKKCSKKFYIEVDLRDHEKLCGEPIMCKCGMKFAFKCNMVAHKKLHPQCQDLPNEEDQRKSLPAPSRSNVADGVTQALSSATLASNSPTLPAGPFLSCWSPVKDSSVDFSRYSVFDVSPEPVTSTITTIFPSDQSSTDGDGL